MKGTNQDAYQLTVRRHNPQQSSKRRGIYYPCTSPTTTTHGTGSGRRIRPLRSCRRHISPSARVLLLGHHAEDDARDCLLRRRGWRSRHTHVPLFTLASCALGRDLRVFGVSGEAR